MKLKKLVSLGVITGEYVQTIHEASVYDISVPRAVCTLASIGLCVYIALWLARGVYAYFKVDVTIPSLVIVPMGLKPVTFDGQAISTKQVLYARQFSSTTAQIRQSLHSSGYNTHHTKNISGTCYGQVQCQRACEH
jgi:hypothetical protein